jgi:outer membrane usher protein
VNFRRGPHPPGASHWLACRRLVLCASIATCLAGWHGALEATPAAATTDASPADASAASNGTDAQFDRSLLPDAGQNTTDLSRFEHGNVVEAGTYNADIFLNNTWIARTNVRLAVAKPNTNATPCVTRSLLDQLGLHPAKLSPEQLAQLNDPKACVSIGSLIPGATMSFDQSRLRLDTSVPQAFLQQMPRGYVSPEYWDRGVNAGLLNYNANTFHTASQGVSQTSSYLGLNDGINLAGWQFRNSLAFTAQTGTSDTPAQHRWQNIQTYVQRPLPSLHAQLTVGDSYTDGSVFDSIGIRGVQLATDDRMLPDSLRGYAPVVRGVADTNALVTIRQNGVLIYQATVSPGPFEVHDLYPTGYGGNLVVTVTEADGRVHSFSVPYASVTQLMRPGITRFDIAVGQLRNLTGVSSQPDVALAAVQHGFTNILTGYSGVIGSQGYASALVGTALNTRYGALALDVTQAWTKVPRYGSKSGQSMRISYSKLVPETQTTFAVAAYRYSTGGFLNVTDAALARSDARAGINPFVYVPPSAATLAGSYTDPFAIPQISGTPAAGTGLQQQRDNFTLSMTQRIGQNGGSFFANVITSSYWNQRSSTRQFQVGYNNSFHHIGYNASVIRTVDPTGRYDNEFLLSFNLPLGSGAHAPTLSVNFTHDQTSGTQEQGVLSGTAGNDNQFYYGATASHASNGGGNDETINGGYRSPYTVIDATYGRGSGYSQDSLGLSGSIVAHPGGVTFGQPTGDTIAILQIPGAAGAHLNTSGGVEVDRFGYALIPTLTPYSMNTIQVDPKGLPLDVQLDTTSAHVAPYAGAVVLLKFKTQTGRTIIVHAHFSNGEALPFGAEVFDEKGNSLGVVGQGGNILVRGVKQAGSLTARWQDDNGTAHSCSFNYQLPAQNASQHAKTYQTFDETCTPAAEPLAQVTDAGQ